MLGVKRSGYYKWLKRRVSERLKERVRLLKRILEIFEESRETYGCPRVYEQLRSEGWTCNYKVVEELMRMNEISPRPKRRHQCTTDSKHNLPIAPNVLDRDFTVSEPDEVWVSDITYIDTPQGWLYLCVFIDLFSRKVVGYSMADHMKAQLVLDAFEDAQTKQGRPPIVFHSDRGSQYASDLVREELERLGCIQSMSNKGNCWDNAVAESFFGTLKTELIYRQKFNTQIETRVAIFDYIEIFYNKKRIHSTLGFLTPEEKGLKGEKAA